MDKPETTNFAALTECLGQAAALNLCEQLGGQIIYVRKNMHSDTTLKFLRAFLGEEGVDKLFSTLGGKHVYIPKAPQELVDRRGADIVRRRRAGESNEVLATEYRLTVRQICNIFSRYRETIQGETL